jgi:DNA helicase-2/ATP-dependent DNA helicase PcrA
VSGTKPRIQAYSDQREEISKIVTEVSQVVAALENNRLTSEIAILARTNSQLENFDRELRSKGIPTTLKTSEKFFDRVEVKEALREIRSASVIPSGNDWYEDLQGILRPFGEGDFVQAFIYLAQDLKQNGATSLRQFLREIEDRVEQNNPPTLPGVVLATLHAAKGLEWERVFLVGASENYLPLQLSQSSSLAGKLESDLEEERRLFYVGLTRAKSEIQISYAGSPSPFLAALT